LFVVCLLFVAVSCKDRAHILICAPIGTGKCRQGDILPRTHKARGSHDGPEAESVFALNSSGSLAIFAAIAYSDIEGVSFQH
jgi:hypothetical protein